MDKYQNYQETGYEWLGQIPTSWELSRVGKFFTERSEKVDDVTYPPLSVTMNGIVDQLSDVAKSNDNDNRKLVKKDDFVINSRSDRKGSSGIAPRDGSVSLINIVLAPKKIDPKYIENLFKSYYFKEEYFRNGKGIHWDLWTTRWEQFKNISIPVPPIEEQKLISRYLDKKTSQIDSLVEKIQKKIELLKEQRTSLINHYVTKGLDPNVEMKDSGIEWIGEIPKHWKLQKLTRFCDRVRNGYVGPTRGMMFETGIIYLQGIHTNKIGTITFTPDGPYYVSPDWSEEHSQTILRFDDIVVVQTGSIGNLGYVTEEFDGSNCHAMIIVSTNKTICYGRFLMYSFLSSYVQNFLQSIKTGEILYHINTKKLRLLNVLLPPLHQQKDIVDHLDRKSRFIDQLIEKEERRILLLKEYRQSLISSVVTGKVRVTDDLI